jgi:hypothetical protein
MDVPTTHHGNVRPDKKYSSVLLLALFVKNIPTPIENSMYDAIIIQSIECKDVSINFILICFYLNDKLRKLMKRI